MYATNSARSASAKGCHSTLTFLRPPGYDPINNGAGFFHHYIVRNAGARIVHGFFHLGAKPSVMLPRLTLALDELTHECPNQFGGRPVSRRSFGSEGIAQIGFQLKGENGFLWHVSSLVSTLTILCKYAGC